MSKSPSLDHREFDAQLLGALPPEDMPWYLRAGKAKNSMSIQDWENFLIPLLQRQDSSNTFRSFF